MTTTTRTLQLEAQAEFVLWWDTQAEKSKGGGSTRSRSATGGLVAGSDGLPDRYTISRWRKRLGTLRRNMKKRDEELQKIELRMSEIELRMSEIEQRLNTFLGHPPGYEGPADPFSGKPPEVDALLNKRTALVTERTDLEIRRAALVAEGEEEARLADEHNRTQKQDCP